MSLSCAGKSELYHLMFLDRSSPAGMTRKLTWQYSQTKLKLLVPLSDCLMNRPLQSKQLHVHIQVWEGDCVNTSFMTYYLGRACANLCDNLYGSLHANNRSVDIHENGWIKCKREVIWHPGRGDWVQSLQHQQLSSTRTLHLKQSATQWCDDYAKVIGSSVFSLNCYQYRWMRMLQS